RQRRFRFAVPDRASLERLMTEPLPRGAVDIGSALDFGRELYFDTPTHDLAHKGATVHLQLRREGRARLRLDVLERADGAGEVRRHSAEAEVDVDDPADLFTGP